MFCAASLSHRTPWSLVALTCPLGWCRALARALCAVPTLGRPSLDFLLVVCQVPFCLTLRFWLALLARHGLRNRRPPVHFRRGSLKVQVHWFLAAQRLASSMKGNLGPAWEFVLRWERLEPPQHRTPAPEALLQALVVLAWFCGLRDGPL